MLTVGSSPASDRAELERALRDPSLPSPVARVVRRALLEGDGAAGAAPAIHHLEAQLLARTPARHRRELAHALDDAYLHYEYAAAVLAVALLWHATVTRDPSVLEVPTDRRAVAWALHVLELLELVHLEGDPDADLGPPGAACLSLRTLLVALAAAAMEVRLLLRARTRDALTVGRGERPDRAALVPLTGGLTRTGPPLTPRDDDGNTAVLEAAGASTQEVGAT